MKQPFKLREWMAILLALFMAGSCTDDDLHSDRMETSRANDTGGLPLPKQNRRSRLIMPMPVNPMVATTLTTAGLIVPIADQRQGRVTSLPTISPLCGTTL